MNSLLPATKKTISKLAIASVALFSLYLAMNTVNAQAAELTEDEQKCLDAAIEEVNQSETGKSLFKAWHESGANCEERDAKIFTEYIFHTMKNIKINPCLSSRMINDFANVPAIQMQMLESAQKKLESDACPK